MTLNKSKLPIAVLILAAYMSIGIFGLFQFNHTADMPMAHCPYAVNGYSVCENSVSHIEHWRQFSNTTFSSFFIFSLLILGIILYFLSKHTFLNQKQHFYRWKYYLDSKKSYNYLYRIIKWLSLFENSPPVNTAFL